MLIALSAVSYNFGQQENNYLIILKCLSPRTAKTHRDEELIVTFVTSSSDVRGCAALIQ